MTDLDILKLRRELALTRAENCELIIRDALRRQQNCVDEVKVLDAEIKKLTPEPSLEVVQK